MEQMSARHLGLRKEKSWGIGRLQGSTKGFAERHCWVNKALAVGAKDGSRKSEKQKEQWTDSRDETLEDFESKGDRSSFTVSLSFKSSRNSGTGCWSRYSR